MAVVKDRYETEWEILDDEAGRWFCWIVEYPDEGSVGPFDSEAETLAWLANDVGPLEAE